MQLSMMELSGTAIQCCKNSTHVVFDLAHSKRVKAVSSCSYLVALKVLKRSVKDTYSCCNIKLCPQSVFACFYNSHKISDFFFKHLYPFVFIRVTQCVCCAEGTEHMYNLDGLRVSKGYVLSLWFCVMHCIITSIQEQCACVIHIFRSNSANQS